MFSEGGNYGAESAHGKDFLANRSASTGEGCYSPTSFRAYHRKAFMFAERVDNWGDSTGRNGLPYGSFEGEVSQDLASYLAYACIVHMGMEYGDK